MLRTSSESASDAPQLDVSAAKVAVVGLGYVGLPLVAAFGSKLPAWGFDIDKGRVRELKVGQDRTREVTSEELGAEYLRLTDDVSEISHCNVLIVAVPTPVDTHKQPDLGALLTATRTVASILKRGDVVVFESTVYPGATEEECVPLLEAGSGLKLNCDFFVGYSPERANPGDRDHRLATITKVVAGSTPDATDFIASLYALVVPAGIHRASSIKVAEAAKVIENTQRDVNIALVNEFALIFNRLGIDTQEVLAAAQTKWNFLPFRPGLVGGHCIGVDPYYLCHKAESVGYRPEVILSGRRINDGMGPYVVQQLAKAMARRRIHIDGSRILIMGLAFKENCPDIRNTRVIDIIHELREFGAEPEVCDPWVDPAEAKAEHGIDLVPDPPAAGVYGAVIVAVAHREFREMPPEAIRALCRDPGIVYDLKHVLPREAADLRL